MEERTIMSSHPIAANAKGCTVRSVNVSGDLRHIPFAGQIVTTGFFKVPVSTEVRVHRLGVSGDIQGDPAVHGGPDKAVYCYPQEHYAGWERELQTGPLPPGSFAENLTTEGLAEDQLCIGDILQIGTVRLQVTQPRSPCYKLQIRFNRPDMVALFAHRSLPGWYAAVLQEGVLKPGDPVRVIAHAQQRISVADVWHYSLGNGSSREVREQILASAILPSFWKERIRNHDIASSSSLSKT
jgi:MOSC domain-containing protein YiiM